MVSEESFCLSWGQFHRDARTLAQLLVPFRPFSGIVAVARGGLVPAAIVARELDIRLVDTVSIASYCEEKIQTMARVLKDVCPEIAAGQGEGLLVIDDLADTGTTLQMVRAMLPKAHIAALYAKPLGRPVVDTFVKEVSQEAWIHFPWDLGLDFQAPLVKGESF